MGLHEKLFEVRQKLEPVTKDRKGYNYKYADLASCHEVLDPILFDLGLLWITRPHCASDGRAGVLYSVLDLESGASLEGELLLPMAKEDPQAAGSCVTYARRYALGLFGLLTEEDDDGARATERGTKPKRANPKAEAKKFISESEMSEIVAACKDAAHWRFPDNEELEQTDFKNIGVKLCSHFGVGKISELKAGTAADVLAWVKGREFESSKA